MFTNQRKNELTRKSLKRTNQYRENPYRSGPVTKPTYPWGQGPRPIPGKPTWPVRPGPVRPLPGKPTWPVRPGPIRPLPGKPTKFIPKPSPDNDASVQKCIAICKMRRKTPKFPEGPRRRFPEQPRRRFPEQPIRHYSTLK